MSHTVEQQTEKQRQTDILALYIFIQKRIIINVLFLYFFQDHTSSALLFT